MHNEHCNSVELEVIIFTMIGDVR